jgi:small subunit ribosomal protein S8
MQDPISDMCTRIRNAGMRSKLHVQMPSSKLKCSVLEVLKKEGFIQDFRVKEVETNPFQELEVDLKYFDGEPVIAKIKRVSKPSLRVYKPVDELPRVLNGLGIAVVSTSKGVMSARKARQLGEGGEVLITVE